MVMVLTMPVLGLAENNIPGGSEPSIPGGKCDDVPEKGVLSNPLNSCSFAELVASIAQLAVRIGIPVAAIFIIYSGLLFVTARGNEAKLETAKKSLLWAIIGTAILVGAAIITEVLQSTIKTLG